MSHEIKPSRGVWVQVVRGSLNLNGTTLLSGDGASTEDPGILEMFATEPAEALLFDLQ